MAIEKTTKSALMRTERQLTKAINKMKHSQRQVDKNAAFDEIERLSAKLSKLKSAH